ncbi:MAG: lipoprotein-releasing ABC transporter permease subunit [Alphaproteobacteria bacterium]|nr:lipoprotein-releasing ABC transporter permease subunit [Alphaproteobacteria bacterium]
MFGPFERLVAFRYLRARRKEGFVSVIAGFSLLGISLGVATLIIVMAVMNGFRHELLGRILGLNGHLGVYSVASGGLKGFDPLADAVRRVSGVATVSPLIEGQVMITANGASAGAMVRGMRPADVKTRPALVKGIQYGSLDSFKGGDVVMIGDRLAEKMGVSLDGEVTLISPKGNVTAFGTVPRMRVYRVAAIYHVGMFEYDSAFVYMPLEGAQLFFGMTDTITNLEVMVKNPDTAIAVGRTIGQVLGPRVRIHDWQQANASFFNAIQVERNVMFMILTMIILVAAFNIISGLIMLVKDKGRDIAILRTMGATRGMIMRIFFISGASVGVSGTALGVGLGLLFSYNIESIRQLLQNLTGTELFSAEIYFLSKLPAVVDPHEVFSVVVMALVLSFAATIYPAWRAARLDPVEALRYE